MTPDWLHISESFGARVLTLLAAPFADVLFNNSLIWWPYLVSALGVAVAAFWLGEGGGATALGLFRRRYLSRRIWAHPSAQADYAYYLVNGWLFPVITAPLIVSGGAIGLWLERTLDHLFGAAPAPALPLWGWRALYTVLFFVAYDFGRYAAHSLMHDVPLLWQFHKVHHSAEVLTPLTNYRMHPVELFVMAAVPNLTTGLVSGLCWYGAAGRLGFYSFLGGHVLVVCFNMIGNLRHFQVWVSFGPVLNRWLISPAHHQIHHSRDPRHAGKNRGFELALWDRMRGTLYVPGAPEDLRLGLGDGTDGAWHGVARMYGWPFRYALALCGIGRAPAHAVENPGANRQRI